MKKLLLSIILLSIGLVSFAQLITPFTIRYGVTQKGSIAMIGNTATSCGAAVSSCQGHSCATAHSETAPGGIGVDNDFVQSYIDIDADGTTFMSSSDSLNLPNCSLISFAGLYWGAGGAVGEADGTHWATRANAKLKVNNGAYVSITADATFDNNTGYKSYHNFKDITAIVAATGRKGRYTLANMPLLDDASSTTNRWGGWAIVVVYRNDLMSLRNLIVFNGLTNVSSGNTTTDIPLSGFLTPPVGPVSFELGILAYDGDRGASASACSASYKGDSLLFNGAGSFVPISDAIHPANDIFNSTISYNAIVNPFRNPLFGNTLGHDANIFVPNNATKNYIGNNATTATIRQKTGGETYLTQVVTSAIDVFEPDNRGGLTIVDLNGGTVVSGDTLEYTATIKNIGSNPSINTYIVDTLERNAVYVPGSIRITYGPNSGNKTDVLGDDQGEYFVAARSLKVRIGTGANAVTGGTINQSATGIDSTQIKFRVTATYDCILLLCDNTINNRFRIYGTGFISGNTFNNGSNPVIFDSNGCPVQGTTNTPISSVACQPPSATVNTPVCVGGTINLSVAASSSSTYAWTGPNGFTSTLSNPTITNATVAMSGIYTVVITVIGTACTYTTSAQSVTVNPIPAMTSASTATICSGTTVNIPLTANLAGTFTWIATDNVNVTGESTTLQNTSTLNNTLINTSLVPQTVTYTVTPIATTGNCAGNAQTVTVTVNPTPTVTSASSQTICSGATLSIPLTATVPSTFTWIATNNPNTTGESTTLQNTNTINNTLVNTSAVVQTVTYTVTPTATTGGCGITAQQIVTITVNPVSTMTSAASATICSGGTVNIPLTSTQGGTYTWVATDNTNTTGESLTVQNTSTINNTIINTSTIPQTVNYTVTPTASVGGCVGASQTVAVLVNPTPVISSSASATICSGGTVNIPLTSNIASTYTWIATNNPNTTGESITLQNTSTINNTITNNTGLPQTVTYTVTPTATAGGCVGATQTVTVTVNPLPTMTSATSATICSGTTVNIPLTSSIASTYTWIAANNPNTSGESTTLQNTSTINNTITNNSAVPQTVTYTVIPTATAGGCAGPAQTVTVLVNPSPVLTGSNSATICSGSTVTIPLTSSVPATFTWIAGNNPNTVGETTTLQNSSTISDLIINTTSSPQTVTYTVTPTATTGGCGSLLPQIVTVTVNPMDSAGFSYSGLTYCQSGTDPTPIVAGSGTGTFSSSPAGLLINPATGLVDLSASGLGTYTITYTTNYICPNSSSVTFTITAAPSPVFSYSAQVYCHGDANPSPIFVLPAFGQTFTSSPAGLVINAGTGVIDLTASLPGVYTVTNTIAAAGGCATATATASVTINPDVIINAGADASICSDVSYTLSGTFGGGATSITWTTSGSGSFDNASLPGATYTPSPADIAAGTVTLTINSNDPSGPCPSLSDNILLTITPVVTVSSGGNATICSGTTYTLSGTFGGGATSITWTTSGTGTFDNASLPGATYTPSAADITAGTVTLTITSNDPSGPCTSLSDAMVLTINVAATVSAGGDATICALTSYTLSGSFGGGAGSGTWTTSGTGTFSNTGSPTATYDPSNADDASGSVTLTYTTDDPAGVCGSVTDFMVLTITPRDNSDFSYSSGTYCHTGVNPTPVITGLPGGTFTFSPAGLVINASTGTVSLLPSALGTYSIYYTTNGPCPWTDTVLLTITVAPSSAFSYNPAVYCQFGSPDAFPVFPVGASAGVFSSTPPGLVFVNTTTGVVDLNLTLPGTYDVTNYIAAAGGCAADTTLGTITVNPAVILSAGANDSICERSNYTLNGTISGGGSTITWTSSGTGFFTPNNTQVNSVYHPSLADVSAGSVTLTITSNDPPGPCGVVTDFMVLYIMPAAVVNAGADDTICSGTTVTLNGSFGGGASSITWSSSGTGTFNNATLPNAVYTPSAADIAAGVVILTVTSNDPLGPCPALTDFMFLGINPAVVIAAGPNDIICSSTIYTMQGSFSGGATSITWTTSGTGTFNDPTLANASYTPSAADIAATIVTLTITSNDPYGPCPALSDFMQLSIEPAALVTAGADATICATSNYTLSGSIGGGATTMTWSTLGTGTFDNVNIGNATYTPSPADDAALSVTLILTSDDPPGICGVVSDTIIITITPRDDAGFTYSSIFYCQSGVDPTPTVTGLPGGTFTATPFGLTINPVTGELTLITSSVGVYTVMYLTNGPCPDSLTTSITIVPLFVATFSYPSQIYCENGNPNPMPVFIAGAFGGVFTSSPAGLVVNPLTGAVDLIASTPGTYTVYNTIVASGGCAQAVDSTTFTLTPLDNATIAYPLPAYCANGTNPIPTLTGLPGGTYSNSILGGSINSSTGEVTLPVAVGVYNVIYTTNGNCPNADTVPLNIIAVPVADAGPFTQLGCGDTLQLNGSGSSQGPDYTYQWSTLGGSIISGATTPTITMAQSGTYTILVTDTVTGCSETDTVTVTDLPPPIASFTTSPNPPTGHIPLVVTFTNTSLYANIFLWNFGDGTTSTLQNPTHTYNSDGVYTVTLYASHNGHCLDSAEIIVVTYPNYAIIIPNIFTPNNDGTNDVFFIHCIQVTTLNCYIYDRWGLKLYEWHTVDGGWDGHNANGTNASDGTYFFIYDLIDADGGVHSDKGSFTLLRK